ncbi:MAG: cysteine desulfurase [Coriobacteriales bacterium]|jgi:cysteine desulfurase|nr:cysteine desulfurase [Coriobacteriales bacterium]
MTEAYLDNAATTQPYPSVVAAVVEALERDWGNPSSRHRRGKEAKTLLERSRQTVAEALGVEPREVYFTSGGTESNNLALQGAAWAADATDDTAGAQRLAPTGAQGSRSRTIITSTLEHASVTKTVRNLKRQGWAINYIEALGGVFDEEGYRRALEEHPVLTSVMAVQNELGYRFPLKRIAALRDEHSPQTLLHTDAVQAFGKLAFRPRELGFELASLSAHKIGGPKGVGALYAQKGLRLFTTAHGGGQERHLRSGTEPLPLIAGFAEAVRISLAHREATEERARGLSTLLVEGLRREFPSVIINSRADGSPFIVSFSLPGVDNKAVLAQLSSQGVFVSTASACENNEATVPPGTWRKKHPLPLQAAGIPSEQTTNTFRISFSATSTEQDVRALLEQLPQALAESKN